MNPISSQGQGNLGNRSAEVSLPRLGGGQRREVKGPRGANGENPAQIVMPFVEMSNRREVDLFGKLAGWKRAQGRALFLGCRAKEYKAYGGS